MSSTYNDVLAANARFQASFGDRASLSARPSRHIFILTCMDCRMDPMKFAGLADGEAHVFRNAGGRATEDAIRSMVISNKILGTKECFIIQHQRCGVQTINNQIMGDLLSTSLGPVEATPDGYRNVQEDGGSEEGRTLNWFGIDDPQQTLVDDVARVRAHPLVNPTIVIHGLMYDEHTGALNPVPGAAEAGAARS